MVFQWNTEINEGDFNVGSAVESDLYPDGQQDRQQREKP
jgi:hypothetical protein